MEYEEQDENSREKERLKKEQLEKIRLIRERLQKERLEQKMPEKEQLVPKPLEEKRLEPKPFEEKRLGPEPLEKERMERERLERERFERERLERERLEQIGRQKMENKVFTNNLLFIIPSWGDLLGYPTLGMYVNQKVSKINSDPVIFLSGADYSIETAKGTLHYLFGLGYYYLKFELQTGSQYIIDNRQLTGLVLSDFVYDHMATSTNITLGDDRDVVIAEKVIKVPVDLSFKSENQITFIKGVLMRNLFIPNKDIILEMIEKIRTPDFYQLEKNGHMLLSTHWDFYNKILVSDKVRGVLESSYLNPTAGLSEIVFGADQLLQETISTANLQIISEKISELKRIYSTLEYDPMYLFSILENVSKVLKSDIAQPPRGTDITASTMMPKESIFISAENRMHSSINWPPQIKRNKKEKIVAIPKEPEIASSVKYYVQSPKLDITKTYSVETPAIQTPGIQKPEIDYWEQEEAEEFQLRILKSQQVESKTLPNPPEGNIIEILLYVKNIINENFEMRSIGKAFELARDNLRKIILQSDYMWEMSKYANIYQKKELNMGLNLRDKMELTQKIDSWVYDIKEKERLKRIEEARLENERLEREMLERERLEKERLEREILEKARMEQEIIERERLEKERLERERIEKERLERERLQKEKLEIERMKRERKEREKREKQERKRQRKLDKEKLKLEKMRQREEERLK